MSLNSLSRGSPMRQAVSHDQALTVVIADEDHVCRQRTKSFLAIEPDVYIVAECTQTPEILEALQMHRPDLLVMDPQIPGGSPFDLLAHLPAHLVPLVICVTAQDQYALKAFETRAFDYILKPFDQERLCTAIERVRADIARLCVDPVQSHQPDRMGQLRVMREERFIVKAAGCVVFLDYDEVDWIEAAANYTSIHAGNQVYRLRAPIGQVEKRIAHHNFSRIHRSVIVNLTKIKEVHPCNSGEYMVRVKDGKELACSRGYNASIRMLVGGRV